MNEVYGKKSISSVQLMYAVAVFIIASNLVGRELYKYTGNESWLAVVIAAVASLLLVSIFGKLALKHPGRSLFDINEDVYGIVVGKLVNALYIFYFLTLTIFSTRDLGLFIRSFIMPATPMNIIYAMFLLICVYAVKKGADKMTRYGTFIFYTYLVLALFITALLIPKMHLTNFLPVFTVPLKNQFLSTYLIIMLPLGETIAFLALTQHMIKPGAAGKALRRGVLLGAAVILLLISRTIAVMGEFAEWASSPIFTTIRLIDVGDILTRLEIINAVLQIVLNFFKTSILLYATVQGFTKLLNIERYETFSVIIGVLVLISTTIFFQTTAEHLMWFNVAAVFATFFLLILPVATIIVSAMKKKKNNEQNSTETPQTP